MELQLPDMPCGTRGLRPCRSRTQSSIAVSADYRRWFLLNASPDIRAQMESVGLTREEVRDERHLVPGVRFAVDGYVTFARTRPWVEAVASSLTGLGWIRLPATLDTPWRW